jgi:hypothetical protein
MVVAFCYDHLFQQKTTLYNTLLYENINYSTHCNNELCQSSCVTIFNRRHTTYLERFYGKRRFQESSF